jgi:hypothetical protein
METYKLDTTHLDTYLVASIQGERMFSRVVLWVEIDPYSRLIVNCGIVPRYFCFRSTSKSTSTQLPKTVMTHQSGIEPHYPDYLTNAFCSHVRTDAPGSAPFKSIIEHLFSRNRKKITIWLLRRVRGPKRQKHSIRRED